MVIDGGNLKTKNFPTTNLLVKLGFYVKDETTIFLIDRVWQSLYIKVKQNLLKSYLIFEIIQTLNVFCYIGKN